jgi:hypothetical protein
MVFDSALRRSAGTFEIDIPRTPDGGDFNVLVGWGWRDNAGLPSLQSLKVNKSETSWTTRARCNDCKVSVIGAHETWEKYGKTPTSPFLSHLQKFALAASRRLIGRTDTLSDNCDDFSAYQEH